MFKDALGQVWIGNNADGVDIIDEKKLLIKHIDTEAGLSSNSIRCFLEQGVNKLWIGTLEGISILDEKETFRLFKERNNKNIPIFWGLSEDSRGQMWVGTDNGVRIIDPKRNTVKYINIRATFYSIIEDSWGRIWLGTLEHGYYVYDPASKLLKHVNIARADTKFRVFSLFEDSRRQMWMGYIIGQTGGVMRVEPRTYTETIINTGVNLMGAVIFNFLEDRKGHIWFSAYEVGIFDIDPKSGTFKQFNELSGLKSKNVTALLIDSLQRIWVGTIANGMDLIDPKVATITHLSRKEGLADDGVFTLKQHKQEIQALTTNGLTVFTTSETLDTTTGWIIKNYRRTRGFSNTEPNIYESVYTKDGAVWWGLGNRIVIMPSAKADNSLPNTIITGLDIINEPQYFTDAKRRQVHLQRTDSLWDSQLNHFYPKTQLPPGPVGQWDSLSGGYELPVNLRLPYDQNYLSFRFSATEDGNFDKTVYRYFLEGVDSQWSVISENPISKNYLNLPSGPYTFKVSSKGFSGRWSKPAEFSFRILPPWWQTWWAYALYVLAFVAALRTYGIFRSKALLRENRLLEEKVALRTNEVQQQKEEIEAQRDNLEQTLETLQATQAQLIQKEKLASLGELTAGIAHEIQNPLNFVNNFSEVSTELVNELKEEAKAGRTDDVLAIADDLTQNLQKITHHGGRASAIVKGMLEHSRTSTGEKQPTGLNALADEYLRLAYHGHRAKNKDFNAQLITDFDSSLSEVSLVAQDIGRVLLNLYNNAFYAVQQRAEAGYEPTVWVSTTQANGHVEIRVRDNGMGISEAIKAKIFQPFFTTKPTGEGTGLGLSLSYDIITKGHGGTIEVETKEGEGTTFTVTLKTI